MLAIIFALITFVGWGAGDVFTAVGSRKIGAFSTAFWTTLFGLFLSLFYLPFAVADLSRVTGPNFVLNIFLGVVVAVAWYFFTKALEVGNPTIVGTIGAAFTSLVVLFSIVYFKESITVSQLLAIILAFIGVVLTSLDFKVFRKGVKLDKGVVYAILTMFLWGIYFTFIKIPIREMGWYLPGLISTAVIVSFYVVYLALNKIKLINPIKKKALKPLWISTTLTTVGTYSFNFALGIGLSAIVAPIAGGYPVLFVLLSYLVFKEKLTKQQLIGILFTLVGIVALSYLGA